MASFRAGTLRAGTAAQVITPRIGYELTGYGNRPDVSTSVHDDLYVRALVISDGTTTVALCSVEMLWLWTPLIAEIREYAAQRCNIPPEHLLIACTHTHAGPAPHQPENWPTPLAQLIAEAIITASQQLQPVRIGFGFGQLFGYSINRRWLNRPTDPSVGVMRVDTADGQPLAVVSNFGCHAVVLGYDNLLISGDWPGYSSRHLEAALPGCTALFTQGGAADVNPLTETVRQRLAAGHPVGSMGSLASYYGEYQPGTPDHWNIEDRKGGTFLECETLALAYNAEVMRVWRSISLDDTLPIVVTRLTVNGAVSADEPAAEGLSPLYRRLLGDLPDGTLPLEIMLLRLGEAVFMTQPGEVFSETAVEFRKTAQQIGYRYPWLISYANGSYAYLPPANAFDEGGYEVAWARQVGLSRRLQDRIADAAVPIIRQQLR